MSAEAIARLAEGLAPLIWPVLALIVALALPPVSRDIARQRQFAIKIGNFELSAQQATDQFARQIEDLQSKMAGMEGQSRPSVAHEARPRFAARSLALLWIDDQAQNHAVEIASLEADGHRVVPARNSGEAARVDGRQAIDVVLSDVARSPGGREGIAYLHEMRQSGDTRPFGFYTSDRSMARRADEMSGAVVATASSSS